MDFEIKNKYALVTGCSKNIGKSIALSLAKEGVNVIGVARSKKNLSILKNQLDKYSTNNLVIPLDLLKKNNVKKLIKTINNKKITVNIIVHNLGGSLNITNPFSSINDWIEVWNYNLGISIELNNHFIPKMIKSKWGRVVHISSMVTTTNKGYIPYVVSKNSLEGYVKSFSKELSKYNVIMNSVAPGLVNLKNRYFSDLKKNNAKKFNQFLENNIPIMRMAEKEEIASLVTFLCSNHSSYMPGSIVKIDGVGN